MRIGAFEEDVIHLLDLHPPVLLLVLGLNILMAGLPYYRMSILRWV